MKKTRLDDSRHFSHFLLKIEKDLVKIMLAVFLISISSLQAQATDTIGQEKITLRKESVSVKAVLKEIEKQSKLRFFYNTQQVDVTRKVSVDFRELSLKEAIEQLFKDTSINFKFSGRQILLYQSLVSSLSVMEESPNANGSDLVAFTVSGLILDETGQPLPGVNIVEKGTTNGATSDSNGKYTVQSSDGNGILIYSFIGYLTQEVPIDNRTIIDITLQSDILSLQEVVIVGYGTSSKKELVSAVSNIGKEALQNQPILRLDQALQGRATGVQVTSNNGAPGAGSTIRIRGSNSINGNNSPLFVIDGFITGTDFNLNNLNVNDIESIDVLKDATALSIYGTRGAAGVVLVTTKSGKGSGTSEPTVTFHQYLTSQTIANQINVLNGTDYINYVNESGQFIPGPLVNVGGTNLSLGRTDPTLPLRYPDVNFPTTNWLNQVAQSGALSNTDLSIGGNTEKVNYYVSLGRIDQKGVLRNSGLERYNMRTNIDIKASSKFTTGLRLNISDFKQENNKVDYSDIVSSVLPVRSIYKTNGSFTDTNPISGVIQRNPEADILLRTDHDLVTNLIGNVYAEYEIIKGLKIKSSFGAEMNFFRNNVYLPGSLPERAIVNSGGQASINSVTRKSLLNENTITYDRKMGDHSIKFLGGFTWQKVTDVATFVQATGFPNDVVTFNNLALGSDPARSLVGSSFSQRTLASFLGRINYAYRSKYNLTLVARQDGSSVFEDGNKWSLFPSVGVAWNIDQENFYSNLPKLFSSTKLRASYGVVGEQGVSPYNSFNFYDPVKVYFNQTLANGVILGRPASSGLKWETTTQFDAGLEIGLFKNRLTLEVDYYQKTTENLLLLRSLPGTAGAAQLQNVGSIENKGFEILITSVNISNKELQWETSLTLSANRSKVLSLGGDPFIALQSTGTQAGESARIIVGQPLPIFFGAEYLGTYKTAEEIIADKRVGKSYLGSPRYRDVDGNGDINTLDYKVLGNPQPDFFGGIRNKVTYKGITLDVFFHGQYGNKIFNIVTQRSYFGRQDENLDPLVVNRWVEGTNETSNIPRAGTSAGSFNPNSSISVEDGSFLRLRQVTLGYNLPLQKLGIRKLFKSINIYASGNNLLLISNFKLGDPEVSSITGNSGFNSVSQGFSGGVYPYAKSYTIGLNVEF
jgi:TonB-dependent starch-binding outer membrane protein SusC